MKTSITPSPRSRRFSARLPVIIGAVFMAFAAALPATAAIVVASYQFNSGSLSSSDTDSNSTASDIVVGGGLSGKAQFITYNSNPGYGTYSNNTPATEAAAISADDYFAFTTTPASGALTYNTLTYNLESNANNISGVYQVNVSVRWSVDGFASTLTTTTGFDYAGFTNVVGGSVDLSTTPAQSGPVTFRFYFFDNQDESSFTNVGLDNIVLMATAVPEPATWPMVLGGIGALVGFRRRR